MNVGEHTSDSRYKYRGPELRNIRDPNYRVIIYPFFFLNSWFKLR